MTPTEELVAVLILMIRTRRKGGGEFQKVYMCERIDSEDPDVVVAWRLRHKRDGDNYVVSVSKKWGCQCSCPNFTNKTSRHNLPCKHILALKRCTLLPGWRSQ